MSFVLQILNLFKVNSGLKITLSSGAPAGSGLGGSSAMGVTLYKALDQYYGLETSVTQTVLRVKGVEGRILNQGVPGYQDYYPALIGGVLALRGTPGVIECEQLYSEELKDVLESHITLVYSGISRNSGINNWDVYKSFFDKNESVRKGLSEIAKISFETYKAIKDKNYSELIRLIGQEGQSRKFLSSNIVPVEVETIYQELSSMKLVTGLKMCGAGGGGCFILTHDSSDKESVAAFISKTEFKVLDFNIDAPLK
jgi:D-glycero-alpha-D-manno-heptose-7-phosphate kinase